MDPPAKVINAIKEVTAEESHLCHGYMPNAGYPETRKAMAKKTSLEQGVEIPFENIIMAVGAAGALNVTMKALLNDGDEVIVPCPYFTEYDHYIHNHGGEIVRVKTKEDFGLDAGTIKAALNEHTAAVLINSPNNPTGNLEFCFPYFFYAFFYFGGEDGSGGGNVITSDYRRSVD